ncbi:AbrB/MazE/SpoVT family DNA-binding domain-containing protein [Lacticaseibacillus sharpeae]|uniref:AbrB/MazE/SpoVT family DNA-binding domain-containing protein n=1 Tax=Lacticaseibacillus sharpeae TaxID=1626 RepID=UPI0006D25C04|nr:hypothetical protein [Lacticaseibacillus sharpeae]
MEYPEYGVDEVLGTFTVRRTGNSLSVTLPSSAGLKEGTQVVLTKNADGKLVYTPQRVNPWYTEAANYDFRADLDKLDYDVDGSKRGKEL